MKNFSNAIINLLIAFTIFYYVFGGEKMIDKYVNLHIESKKTTCVCNKEEEKVILRTVLEDVRETKEEKRREKPRKEEIKKSKFDSKIDSFDF